MKIFLYTFPVALLVAYSQLVVKWRLSSIVALNTYPRNFTKYLSYFLDPYIFSAYVAALLSSIIWLVVIQKISLSIGFPIYIGTAFLLVMIGSAFILGEIISFNSLLAALLIFAGIILGSIN
jgi:multidrug transporter EmrE-like cation transporter